MNILGFTAEASLCKSRWSYCGYGGTLSGADAPLNVVVQQDCQSQCASQYECCEEDEAGNCTQCAIPPAQCP
jgi:hypothetical protein